MVIFPIPVPRRIGFRSQLSRNEYSEQHLIAINQACSGFALKSSFVTVRQVSVQSVFRDSLAAIELLDAAFNLGVDLVPIFREPTILLLLRIQ